MNSFYKFCLCVMRVIMPLWYKIDADGLEYLPENGGCLFISNHRSMADPILIGVQNPQAQFCFLAKQELFSEGFVGWLLKKLGAVAIDRGTGDTDPLEEIIYRLQNGENALIFPEGTRSKDGKLGRFKTGAALIAAQTDVPVVPVGISFDDEELHFRSIIHIRYGEPFRLPQTDPKNPSPAVLKEIRQEMTKNVSALLTMDDSPGRKAIAQKETVYSDGDESAEVPEQKGQPAVEIPGCARAHDAESEQEDGHGKENVASCGKIGSESDSRLDRPDPGEYNKPDKREMIYMFSVQRAKQARPRPDGARNIPPLLTRRRRKRR